MPYNFVFFFVFHEIEKILTMLIFYHILLVMKIFYWKKILSQLHMDNSQVTIAQSV